MSHTCRADGLSRWGSSQLTDRFKSFQSTLRRWIFSLTCGKRQQEQNDYALNCQYIFLLLRKQCQPHSYCREETSWCKQWCSHRHPALLINSSSHSLVHVQLGGSNLFRQSAVGSRREAVRTAERLRRGLIDASPQFFIAKRWIGSWLNLHVFSTGVTID